MQHEFVSNSSTNVEHLVPSSASPQLFVQSEQGIPFSLHLTTSCDFPALSPSSPIVFQSAMDSQYAVSPPFMPSGTPPLTLTPSPVSLSDEDPNSIENLYLSRIALQYQQIAERYELCLSQIHDTELEAEAMNQQNTELRRANDEFYRRLGINPETYMYRNPSTSKHPPISLLDDQFRLLSLAEPPDGASPTSVFGFQDNRLHRTIPAVDEKRFTLPKSISIRSSRYLKVHQTAASSADSNRNIRRRPTTPVTQQKVYLGGGEGKKNGGEAEDAVELDVYNQGMFKTELCNKWQETGECPYGEHCQFAHGFGELRPVIRHPRYKTELCRMVLAGDTCPYGHRCHFRHAISPNDRPLRST